MDSTQLYHAHQAYWQRLTDLILRAEQDIHALSPSEIAQMGEYYHLASSDLALALRDFPHHQLTAYLN
jgi:hypothetical protein